MHLDEEQVQRLLHGELGETAEASVREHLDSCSECRRRLNQAEEEEAWILDRLRRLDHAPPQVSAPALIAAHRRLAPAWGRLAAGIFLALVAAGIAYAAPGSPLPRFLDRIIHSMRPVVERPVESAPVPNPEPQAGIAVAPGVRLVLVFTAEHSGDTALVSLTDGADVVVRGRGGTTTFTSGTERLAIAHQGAPARYEILIPRLAPWVEIRVGSRRVFVKKGTKVLAERAQGGNGRYLLPLSSTIP